jgi:serine/threonine protein phosphatase PrpC
MENINVSDTLPIEDDLINPHLIFGMTDSGKVRKNNEDAFDAKENIYIVTDGMGGHNAGEVASQLTIEYLQEKLTVEKLDQLNLPDNNLLQSLLHGANEKVKSVAQSDPELHGMGCTIVVGCITGNTLHVCHAGDARAYIVNKNGIKQIGIDHSNVADAVLLGEMTREEARLSAQKNIITQAIGGPKELLPEYLTVELKSGDRIILCSDGLWDMLPDEDIKNIVMSLNSAQDITEQLIDESNKAGGVDNITVITIIVE